jgi:hypothetical protein
VSAVLLILLFPALAKPSPRCRSSRLLILPSNIGALRLHGNPSAVALGPPKLGSVTSCLLLGADPGASVCRTTYTTVKSCRFVSLVSILAADQFSYDFPFPLLLIFVLRVLLLTNLLCSVQIRFIISYPFQHVQRRVVDGGFASRSLRSKSLTSCLSSRVDALNPHAFPFLPPRALLTAINYTRRARTPV